MSGAAIPAGYKPVDVGDGFSATLGGLYVDHFRQRVAFRVGAAQCNPVMGLHGGAIATFADAQIIAIDRGSEARTSHHPTISLTVDFLAPAFAGDWVEAEVTLDRRTRTFLFTRALISVGDLIVARASAIYRNTDKSEG